MNETYCARVAQVLRYIEENLGRSLSLGELAEVSHFSPYHFHRIFGGVMGETVNDYVRRRRVETAVNLLAFRPHLSITDVALSCGFSSSANFAKALTQYFGYAPSQIRQPNKIKNRKIGKVFSKYGKEFDPYALYPWLQTTDADDDDPNPALGDVRVEQWAAQSMVQRLAAGGYTPAAVFGTWDRLIALAEGHGVAASDQQRFGLCYDNPAVTPLDKCRYEAAVVLPEAVVVKRRFVRSTLPAGPYAVLPFVEPADETSAAQLGLYARWLPSSGFEPDGFPLLERYRNDGRQTGIVEMDICIKLRKLE